MINAEILPEKITNSKYKVNCLNTLPDALNTIFRFITKFIPAEQILEIAVDNHTPVPAPFTTANTMKSTIVAAKDVRE